MRVNSPTVLIKKLFHQTIHQSYFVVAMCIGIISGTITGLIWRINYFGSPFWIVFALLLLLLAYLRPRLTFFVIALIAGSILSFFRVANELSGEAYLRNFYDQTVTITGVIMGDPVTSESATKFKLAKLRLNDDSSLSIGGSIYVSATTSNRLHRSDQITLKGKLSGGFGTYIGFMYRPTIVKLSRPRPGDLILGIRDWFSERIASQIPAPEVNLGLSYLLGMKTNLPSELSENLRAVGLVHIVVASGAHLSILVGLARRVFGKISRFSGLLFSILFVLGFMTMVGFTPSIMRAGIMSILSLLAWYVGRKFAPWRIILIVAAITLIINPIFIIDLGWLLSFASFAGIMIMGPILSRFFYGNRRPGFVANMILTTISATLMTLPITLYYFGTFSFISVFANLLILPTLSVAMGLTFLTGAIAGIPFLDIASSFLTTKLLSLHILVVNLFASAKQFIVTIDSYQWQVFLLYIPIVIILLLKIITTHFHRPYLRKSLESILRPKKPPHPTNRQNH